MIIIGLDLSLNNSAFCLRKNGKLYFDKLVDTSQLEYTNIIDRCALIANDLEDKLNEILTKRQKMHAVYFIENVFIQQSKIALQLNALGTIIRWLIFLRQGTWFNVSPQTLKSFILGKAQTKGGNKKQLMLKAIYKNYQYDFDDDNTADAFALHKFGVCYFERKFCLTQHQTYCIERFYKQIMEV